MRTMRTIFLIIFVSALSFAQQNDTLNYTKVQINSILADVANKAPTASPTFTGTVTLPTPFTLGAVSVLPTGIELNYVDGVTSAIQTQLNAKAPLASPTFTTQITVGSGVITATEAGYIDPTSSIQTQLDNKQPLEATLTDIADGTIAENLVNTTNPWADNEVANSLTVDEGGIASTIARDSEVSTLLDSFYDTLTVSWGMMDTTIAGDVAGWKVPNNITITEVSAYTDANTCTFNIEERAETTPNTAGTDVMTSDLVADNNQQETATFTNADIAKDTWLVPVITSTGDVEIFSITVRYVKTN